MSVLLALLTLASAESPWWKAVPWGQPLPKGLETEHDWPWGAREGWDCAWRGELLLCAQEGEVREAWRRSEEPVAEGPVHVLRTAGYEWSHGLVRVEMAGQLDRVFWGTPSAPHRGWEGAQLRELESSLRHTRTWPLVVRSTTVLLEDTDLLKTEGLEICSGTLFAQPIEVLFDDSGQARLFRVQGLPELDADWECIATVMLQTQLADGDRRGSVEGRLSLLGSTPKDGEELGVLGAREHLEAEE